VCVSVCGIVQQPHSIIIQLELSIGSKLITLLMAGLNWLWILNTNILQTSLW